jgi:hypothetical protein
LSGEVMPSEVLSGEVLSLTHSICIFTFILPRRLVLSCTSNFLMRSLQYNNSLFKEPCSVLWPTFHCKFYFLVTFTSRSMTSTSLLIIVHHKEYTWCLKHFSLAEFKNYIFWDSKNKMW